MKQKRKRKQKRKSHSKALVLHRRNGMAVAKSDAPELRANVATIQALRRFDLEIAHKLNAPTPEERIKFLPDSAGKKAGIAYVTDDYIRERLEEVFGKGGWRYTFEIGAPAELLVKTGWVVVKGRLEVLTPAGWVCREQYGTGKVQFQADGKMIDPDIGFKGAATDALKKCANSFGVAEDVYSGKHHRVKKEEKRRQVVEQRAETQAAEKAGDHVKELQEFIHALLRKGLAQKEDIVRSLLILFPKRPWKRRAPNIFELSKAEAEQCRKAWTDVDDRIAKFGPDGRLVGRD